MRYINLHFTYLLTYLFLSSITPLPIHTERKTDWHTHKHRQKDEPTDWDPIFHGHMMANQIDLRSTLGLDQRSSQWPFFHPNYELIIHQISHHVYSTTKISKSEFKFALIGNGKSGPKTDKQTDRQTDKACLCHESCYIYVPCCLYHSASYPHREKDIPIDRLTDKEAHKKRLTDKKMNEQLDCNITVHRITLVQLVQMLSLTLDTDRDWDNSSRQLTRDRPGQYRWMLYCKLVLELTKTLQHLVIVIADDITGDVTTVRRHRRWRVKTWRQLSGRYPRLEH